MIANLIYDAMQLCYVATPSESELKGALIADLNIIEQALKQPAIDADRFNHLMSLSLKELQIMCNDQSALLDRIKSENNNP